MNAFLKLIPGVITIVGMFMLTDLNPFLYFSWYREFLSAHLGLIFSIWFPSLMISMSLYDTEDTNSGLVR